jgi:hypothetical protein
LGIRIEPVSTFSGGIVNAASGKVTAALSDIGIFNFANFSGGVTNSGTLTSTIGVGIEVNNGSTFSGGVTNNGSISAKGTGINIAGISQFAGGVTNTGTITSATRIGIHVSGINQFGSSAGGGISNTGVISGKTGIVLGSGVSTFSGVIFNSGTIAGTGGTAIDVHNANNAITIDQAGGLISGNILLSTNADVVNVTGGAINGNILGRGVSDTLNFSLGAGTFTYGAAHGFIGINAVNVNSGMVILDGENNATATTVNGGNLQIGDAANPGALLTSTVNVDGGTLSGHGTILGAVTVNNGGTLAPGGSIGTLTINGSLVFNAGSAYAIQVSDTMASKTLVTGTPGTATINGGAVVAAPQFALGSHGGVTFTILTAAGGRTGTFPALTADAPNFTGTFSLNYDANDVFLNVGKGFEILPQPPGGTINQKEVVAGINHAILGGATVPANFQTLAGLSGTSYLNALTQLSGEVTTGAQAAAFQLGDQFLNLMLNPSSTVAAMRRLARAPVPSALRAMRRSVRPAMLREPTPRSSPRRRHRRPSISAGASGAPAMGASAPRAAIRWSAPASSAPALMAMRPVWIIASRPTASSALRSPAAAPAGTLPMRSARDGAMQCRPALMASVGTALPISAPHSLLPTTGSPPTAWH